MPFMRRWLSPKEVAQEYNLHLQTVYDLYRKGKIAGGKVGGSVRLDKQKIDEMLSGRMRKKS